MKQIKYLFLAVLSAVMPVGCVEEIQKENHGDSSEPGQMTFQATFDSSTKTTLVDNVNVWWSPGDNILVSNGENSEVFLSNIEKASEVAVFKGDLQAAKDNYYAGYPNYYDGFDGSRFKAFCSLNQNAVVNTFDSGVNIAVARCSVSERSFKFKNVLGYIKFTINEDCNWNIKSVEVLSKNGEPLSGYCVIDCSADDPCVEPVENGTFSSVKLTSEAGMEEGTYYIALFPGTYTNGLTFHITSLDDKVSVKSIDAKVTVEKGVIYNIGSFASLEDYKELERNALMSLYQSTGGDAWSIKTNWGSDEPLDQWYGVSVDLNGFVYGLNLSANNLQGSIPGEIGKLKHLKNLMLVSNKLQGNLPAELYTMSDLKTLWLSSNELTGEISEAIGALSHLENLDLGYNNFSGTLPEELGDLTKLQTLSLEYNRFSGSVPTSLSNLTDLISLSLESNTFTGGVDFVTSLVNLGDLRLRDNQFSGSLPEKIGSLTNLKHFDIANNMFSGGVPESLSNIFDGIDRYHFYLDQNAFTGSLPEEISGHDRFEDFWPSVLNQDISKGGGIDVSELVIPAPKGSVSNLRGETISLEDYYSSNKLTIWLNWAAWCPHSMDLIQYLIPLYNAYKSKGLGMLAYDAIAWVSPCDTQEHIISAIDKRQIPWENNIVMSESGDVVNNFICSVFKFTLPEIAVVDSEGNIVLQMRTKLDGYDTIHEALSALLAKELGNVVLEKPELYESMDYGRDGEVITLQTHSKGAGIDVVLMGDGFVDTDMETDGTYEQLMRKTMESLFVEAPMKHYRDYFDVYAVKAVSKHNIISTETETIFDTWFGNGTEVGGKNEKCLEYANKVEGIDLTKSIVICLMNQRYYAGTCYMFTDNSNVSYFPLGYDDTMLTQLVNHEAVGHGFGKLLDEYEDNLGYIPLEEINSFNNKVITYGWGENVDIEKEPEQVKWKQFLSDTRYSEEGLGVFEGALTYQYGAYRPSSNSIMRYNTGGFNAPSRFAIWKRIMEYGGVADRDYADFANYDEINRNGASAAMHKSRRANYVEVPDDFEPLAPPVIIDKTWREVVAE